MDLQERLERILDERRGYVVSGLTPAAQAFTLVYDLPDLLDGATKADDDIDRDKWLVRLAGACLYLMHPEDEVDQDGHGSPREPAV